MIDSGLEEIKTIVFREPSMKESAPQSGDSLKETFGVECLLY